MLTTKDKSRLIHAVGLVQVVADELRQDSAGRSVANLIGRHLGAAGDDVLGADAQGAAAVVQRVLAKTTPEKAAGAIVATIGKVRETVAAADLPGNLSARASQLLGMADASAKLAYANLRQEAPASQRAGYKKPVSAPGAIAPAATDKSSAGGWAGQLGKIARNPWAIGVGVVALLALARGRK